MAVPSLRPTMAVEEGLWASGVAHIAGVDEVGRGPLAGPVYAAAVILDQVKRPGWLEDLRDSKQISASERERLARAVREESLAWSVGWASVAEIDAWGITRANSTAMLRALARLPIAANHVLVDGPTKIPGNLTPQDAIVDGDATCTTIAAASIIAKTARDEVMCVLDRRYPEYGFADHKGYATAKHLRQIETYGLCSQHRRSWSAIVKRLNWKSHGSR